MIEPLYIPESQLQESLLLRRVCHYVETFAQLWRESAHTLPDLGDTIGFWDKRKREKHFKKFMQQAGAMSKQHHQFLKQPGLQDQIFNHVHHFLTNAVGMSAEQLDLLMSEEFKNSTKEFVAMARKFDASLSPADLFQACRNVWIMNGLQLLLGLKVEFTPAICAYSLLYPYTDNYLDDISVSQIEKISFNERFCNRLKGEFVQPRNSHEKSIFALVEIIEMQFNRAVYPEVFDSLIAIQKAQAKSVLLIHDHRSISDQDILEICLEKGGASVVADGYLVAGNLTEDQERFLFGYGAYLQFLDDVQDVREDAANGQKTVYSIVPGSMPLDGAANQTFVFGEKVIDLYPGGQKKPAQAYIDIMRTSIRLMLIEAICFAEDSFSPLFLSAIEKKSPFRFKILKKLKRQHEPYYMSMFGKAV